MRTFSKRAEGLDWHFLSWGNEQASRRVLFLHGFTGSAEVWEGTGLAIASANDALCLAVDLPGHGLTTAPLPSEAWSLDRAADALADMMEAPFDVVGYSLGARLALHLADRHPAKVKRLAVIGANPGLVDETTRAARRLADARWIHMLEQEPIDDFVAAWEAQPLFSSEQRLPESVRLAARQRRLGQNPQGLAGSLAAFGLGTQANLREALSAYPGLIHWIAGANDLKFAALAQETSPLSAQSQCTLVAHAGHNVLLERPKFLLEILQRFLFPAGLSLQPTERTAADSIYFSAGV